MPSVEEKGERGKTEIPGRRPRADNESVAGANADRAEGGNEAFPVLVDPYGTPRVPAQQLVAVVTGTAAHPGIRGEVRFSDSGTDLYVTSSVTGLPAGAHAHHVHLFGDCSALGTDSAGPHFDFARGSSAAGGTPGGGAAGGGLAGGATGSAISGDLGDLTGTSGAAATSERILSALELGLLLGRSVVIHAGANDPSQVPDGGAGEPIACGVIGIVGRGAGTGAVPGSIAPSAGDANPGQIRNPPPVAPAPPSLPAPGAAPNPGAVPAPTRP